MKDEKRRPPVKAEASSFERFEDFTRRLLRVSKKEIDAKLAEERAARAKRRLAKARSGRMKSRSRP